MPRIQKISLVLVVINLVLAVSGGALLLRLHASMDELGQARALYERNMHASARCT